MSNSRQPYQLLSSETRLMIRNMAKEGVTDDEIIEKFGITKRKLRGIKQREEFKPIGRPGEKIDEIQALYENAETYFEEMKKLPNLAELANSVLEDFDFWGKGGGNKSRFSENLKKILAAKGQKVDELKYKYHSPKLTLENIRNLKNQGRWPSLADRLSKEEIAAKAKKKEKLNLQKKSNNKRLRSPEAQVQAEVKDAALMNEENKINDDSENKINDDAENEMNDDEENKMNDELSRKEERFSESKPIFCQINSFYPNSDDDSLKRNFFEKEFSGPEGDLAAAFLMNDEKKMSDINEELSSMEERFSEAKSIFGPNNSFFSVSDDDSQKRNFFGKEFSDKLQMIGAGIYCHLTYPFYN